MKKNKITCLLLLLFATYSCAIEELQPEPLPISTEILKNVNPAFLEHDLSRYKIKPFWKSAVVFKSSSAASKRTKFNDAVEFNFTQDNKTTIPLSKNGKIRGRQRLLLTFEDGKIRETIIEYIPSDDFVGDIKDINSGNFKSKQFDGEITFQNPKKEAKIVWYLSKGIVVKKAKSSSKKNKPSKTSRYVSVYSCHTYEVCVGTGGEEVCSLHERCDWGEVWEEDPDSGIPPPDPYDCSVNASFPWCQDNGGGYGGGGDGTGGGGNPPTDPPVIETTITIDSPDIPITDIIDHLECFDRNQGASITIYSNQPIANSTYLLSITDSVGHSFITIDQGQNRETIGFYPAGMLPGAFGPVWGIMGDNSNNTFDVSITINVSAQTLSGILDESIIWGSATPYDLHNKNCTDFAITIGNLSGLNIPDCYGSFYNGTGGSTPGRFGEYLREMQLQSGATRNTTTNNSPTNKRNCF